MFRLPKKRKHEAEIVVSNAFTCPHTESRYWVIRLVSKTVKGCQKEEGEHISKAETLFGTNCCLTRDRTIT